jgi:catechol 2,3-dioxygenase-like lactoylglutathione lyase family enzyme
MDLNQVTLPCTDLQASVRFYTRLGFKQIVSSPPRYAFEVKNLDSTVAQLQVQE